MKTVQTFLGARKLLDSDSDESMMDTNEDAPDENVSNKNACVLDSSASTTSVQQILPATQGSELSSPTFAAVPKKDNSHTPFLKVIVNGSFFDGKIFLPHLEEGLTWQVH